jgi:Aldo/keto reductase family
VVSAAQFTLNNGVEMPALGLGVFQTPPEQTTAAVRAGLGAGYRLIDTAAAYGNERQVGEAVRPAAGAGVRRRARHSHPAWSPIAGITFYRDGRHGGTLRDPVIDALDTGVRGGPEPSDITLETFGRVIPEQ